MATITDAESRDHPQRVLRKARGWSIAELADRAGLSPATVNRIESGARIVHTDSLRAAAHALGVDWRALCGPGQAVAARNREELADVVGDHPVTYACESGQDPRAIVAEWLGLDPTDNEVRQLVESLRNSERAA